MRLLHVANAYFLRDYNTYLSEAELRGYYAWGGDSDVCQWETHWSVPEPSPEIKGDFVKWDKTKLAGLTRLELVVDVL